MSYEEVDCPDKMCFLEYHFSKLCSIVKNNGTDGCTVPCNMTNCAYEVHRNINCPTWSCVFTTTTTDPPTTSTIGPSTNQPEAIMITSLVANAVLIIIVVLFGFFKIKSCHRRRQYEDPEREFLARENERPIIRAHANRMPDSFSMISLENAQQDIIDLEGAAAVIGVNQESSNLNQESSTTNPFVSFKKFEEKKIKHQNKIV